MNEIFYKELKQTYGSHVAEQYRQVTSISPSTLIELHKIAEKEAKKEAKNVSFNPRRKYLYKGEMMTLTELSRVSGLSISVLFHRINKMGWSIKKAVETPKHLARRQKAKQYKYQGKKYSLSELAEISNHSRVTLYNRIEKLGWTVKQAIETPKNVTQKKKEGIYEYQGEKYTLVELSKLFNIPPYVLYRRIQRSGAILHALSDTPKTSII